MSELIPIDTNLDAMIMIQRLSEIALTANSFNVNPIEIKERLLALEKEQLIALNTQVTERINERKTVFNGKDKTDSGAAECPVP